MAFVGISQLAGFLVDFWINVIAWFNKTISNYAWSIIVLTVVIKLVMTPLDFFNKKATRQNTKMQAVIQPQLEKLQKKYGNDRNLYNQKVAELYKSHNYNMVGSCLFMLVNLVLTLVVFISLFSGLNYMSSVKIVEQYETLKTEYTQVYDAGISLGLEEQEAKEQASLSVSQKYKQVKYQWLWIENVWKPDSFTNSIPTASEFLKIAHEIKLNGQTIQVSALTDEQKAQFETEYNTIMNPLRETDGKTNGFLILFVLTVGTSFLSQWLMQRKNKQLVSEDNPAASTGKMMMFILPIMLGFFVLTYNSVFSLYLLTSQIIAIITTPLIDLLIDFIEKKGEQKKQAVMVADYNRKKLSKEENQIVESKEKIKKQIKLERKLEKQKNKKQKGGN